MIDPVNRLNQMMEVLRREMADSAAQAEAGKPQTAKSGVQARVAGRAGVTELRTRLHERLRKLDRADPRHLHKAKRVFLETVLAQEFGNDLLLDRRLEDMLDSIQETISANAELDARFNALLEEIGAE
jgi:hypothetical protein